MSGWLRKLGWLAGRRRKEAELREELRFHLEEETELQRGRGLSDAEAQRAARRDLGGLARVEENTRAAWGWTRLEQTAQDVRYGMRSLRANGLFTLAAVASLALGIGANTAIFSFLDAILMRSLPVTHPESLVMWNWRAKRGESGHFVLHGGSGSTW